MSLGTHSLRILIADDNRYVREAIVQLLAAQSDVQVCGEAVDSVDALQKAAELQPDIVLLDVSMPGKDGLETARDLRQKFPQIKILIISQHDPELLLPRVIAAGADGCLDKSRLGTDLLPAIRRRK